MTTVQTSSLREHYSQYYRRSKDHDSPRESRTRMVTAMTTHILGSDGPQRLLNVGSGRRDIEGALQRNARGMGGSKLREKLSQTSLVTFDIAEIPSHRLIGSNRLHAQADSRAMPFRDNAFDLTLSNLSIDMLRRDDVTEFQTALSELSRVTKLGGAVLLNYHPPELFDSLSEGYGGNAGYLSDFYNGDEQNNPYYSTPEDIAHDLDRVGISATDITMHYDKLRIDSWWEVIARRTQAGATHLL